LAREGKRIYDTFRERLVFPIRDERGRIIGMGGRILAGDGPKYINSPETRLYQKSRVLYGLYTARKGIQRANRAIVVEGYFDVLSMHQAGFTEAVASCGTALTTEHIERLRRLTNELVLLLDADAAGSKAAERSLPLVIDAGLRAWRLQLPNNMDPDDLIRQGGSEAMEAAMAKKAPLVEWVVQRKLTAYAASDGTVGALSRERVLEELLPLLARLPDTTISRTAAQIGIHEASLRDRVRKHRATPTAKPSESQSDTPSDKPRWRPDKRATHLLWLLVHRRDLVCDLVRAMPRSFLVGYPDEFAAVVARLMTGEPVAAVLSDLSDPDVSRTMRAVVARTELYSETEAPLGCCQVLARITEPGRLNALREANLELADAAGSGDTDRLRLAGLKKRALLSHKTALDTALNIRDTAVAANLLASAPPFD
jgi:DNA primase